MNPIYLAIPVFIAATLVIACGALFSIIHAKDGEIAKLENLLHNQRAEINQIKQSEREIIDKLEADLKQADEAYDLLVKDNANYTIEIAYLKSVIDSLKMQLNVANARTFTGRKRNNKGQFVTIAKDVES